MTHLFDPGKINRLTMANRFVRSATWAGMATDDGACTDQMIDLMTDLAAGGMGLIITGHAYVHKSGRHQPWQLGIDRDYLIPGLQELTQAVHDNGSNIAVQLGYGGAYLSKARLGRLSTSNIRAIVDAFGQAAARAQACGFDGVQLFAAHGFFLSQFLCPRYNDRKDNYGGSIENRARVLLEVYRSVRSAVGPDFPVLVKLNCRDFVDKGLTLKDSLKVGEMLEKVGIDAIELSGGLLNIATLMDGSVGSEKGGAFFHDEAKAFKTRLNVPLMLVGGIRSFDSAQQMLDAGVADYVSMCRPFICEPDLIHRWQAGDHRKAACISCNNCVEQAKQGLGISCVPLMKEVTSFFPQNVEMVPASRPHPENTFYEVSFGLEEIESSYHPVVKVQMVVNDQVIEDKSPFYPAGTDDYLKVNRVIKKLLDQQGELAPS